MDEVFETGETYAITKNGEVIGMFAPPKPQAIDRSSLTGKYADPGFKGAENWDPIEPLISEAELDDSLKRLEKQILGTVKLAE